MILLLCILLPPVGVLFMGKPGKAIIAFFLCILMYIPGIIYAVAVYNDYKNDKRYKKLHQSMGSKY